MSSDRRQGERYSRRVDVRYWRQGNPQAHSAFSINISPHGLFLGTSQTLEPGERLRLELLGRDSSFVVEGQVARVHRVSISLRHVDQPGAGVRFLLPAELVATLIPAARQVPAGTPERTDEREPAGAEPPTPGPESAPASDGPPPATATALPVVPVDFADRAGFLSAYHRDLASGSLHVSTDVPARLNQTVLIEIRPPLPSCPPLRFEATVVHRFEAQGAVGPGANVLAGMGVRFLDPERVRAELAPILAELRR